MNTYLCHGSYVGCGEGLQYWITIVYAKNSKEARKRALDKLKLDEYFSPSLDVLCANKTNKKVIEEVLSLYFSNSVVNSLMKENNKQYLWDGGLINFNFDFHINCS